MDDQPLYMMLSILFVVFLVLILTRYIVNNWGVGLLLFIFLDFLSRIGIFRNDWNSFFLLAAAMITFVTLSQPYFLHFVNLTVNYIQLCSLLIADVFDRMRCTFHVFVVINQSPKNTKAFDFETIPKATTFAAGLKNCIACPARLEFENPRDVNTEAKRLATFSTIPRNSVPSQCPHFVHLANTGLYYDRWDSCVRCSRCTSTFDLNSVPAGRRDWHVQWCLFYESTTSPNTTHRRNFNSGHQLTTRGLEVTRDRPEENDRDVSEETIDHREAYKSFRARFDSLRDKPWAREPNTAQALAASGMFYGGVSDKLCCCSCNFFITDWSGGRRLVDIRELHTQLNPRCPELRPQGNRV